jgi:hypothetical protein
VVFIKNKEMDHKRVQRVVEWCDYIGFTCFLVIWFSMKYDGEFFLLSRLYKVVAAVPLFFVLHFLVPLFTIEGITGMNVSHQLLSLPPPQDPADVFLFDISCFMYILIISINVRIILTIVLYITK